MLIGCPKEIKNHEYRVGLTPPMVKELTKNGNEILIEANAGLGSGFTNEEYVKAGAKLVSNPNEIFKSVELIIKVKEPQKVERTKLQAGQILFTYLHLAPDREQTIDLVNSGVTAFAYETITDQQGGLPLLTPMSQVAGRLAPQMGAWALQKANSGNGKLLAGVPGVAAANVLIIGGGVVGTQAALIASGMGAKVTVLDTSAKRLQNLDQIFGPNVNTILPDESSIELLIRDSDLIIGAVLVPGAKAPKLISRSQLSSMKKGAVIVDVAIDQGGCFETSRATTHDDPIYIVDGIVHYCVANMPGAVPNTSTLALTNVTMPFISRLSNYGWKASCQTDSHLLNGLNVHNGQVTNKQVAEALGLKYSNPLELIKLTS